MSLKDRIRKRIQAEKRRKASAEEKRAELDPPVKEPKVTEDLTPEEEVALHENNPHLSLEQPIEGNPVGGSSAVVDSYPEDFSGTKVMCDARSCVSNHEGHCSRDVIHIDYNPELAAAHDATACRMYHAAGQNS